ncbi:hypothetical protein N9W41_01145 [bacterium]|nr:hypothetical protein [bacterium]
MNQKDQNSFRTVNIVWTVFVLAAILYSGISYFMFGAPSFDYLSSGSPFPIVLSFLSVVMLVLSFVVPKLMVKSMTMKDQHGISPGVLKFVVSKIVQFALIEAAVLYGFIITFTEQKNLTLPFTIIGFLFFLKVKPSLEEVKSLSRQA